MSESLWNVADDYYIYRSAVSGHFTRIFRFSPEDKTLATYFGATSCGMRAMTRQW